MDQQISLITGLNGFIGKHLSDRLMAEGHKVTGLPRDMLISSDLPSYVKEINPDYIFHLAAYGNMYQQTEVDEIVSANLVKTYMLLASTDSIDYKAFINVSTSSVYGNHSDVMSEDSTLETNTFYGATKVGAEYLCRAWAVQGKKPIATVRPFSVYGPGEADYRFIPTVCDSLITDKTFPLASEPVHDWVYIDDLVDGMLTVVKNIKGFRGESINIGSGVSTTNMEIVTTLEDISGKSADYKIVDSLRSFDSGMWKSDITKLRSTGWKPKTDLVEGLSKTYEYYKQRSKA